jgi:transcriptional regulator with XRE-family HTH domain
MSEHPMKAFRRRHDLSQEALGAAVGVQKPMISKIESHAADPSMDLLRRLLAFAESLGDPLSADDFLRRPEPIDAEPAT